MHNPQQFYANQHPLDSSSLIDNKKHLQWMDLSSGKLKFIRITEHMDSKQSPVSPHFFFFLQAKYQNLHFLPWSVLDMYQILNLKGLVALGQISIIWTSTSLTLLGRSKFVSANVSWLAYHSWDVSPNQKVWSLLLSPRTSKPPIKQENIIYDWKENRD
jgi:hypothetical protein